MTFINREGEKLRFTGIIRKVDKLGRIVIPIEIRRSLDIHVKDPLEIHVDNDKIILQKYEDHLTCDITGKTSNDNLTLADGKITLDREAAKSLLQEIQETLNE